MDPVVALQPDGDLPPFFCVHGVGGGIYHLYRLARHMRNAPAVFRLRRSPDARPTDTPQRDRRPLCCRRCRFISRPAPITSAVTPLVQRSLTRWRCQLEEQGHEIGLLAIIDQRRPGWRLTLGNALPALYRILGAVPQRLREETIRAPKGRRLRHLRRLIDAVVQDSARLSRGARRHVRAQRQEARARSSRTKQILGRSALISPGSCAHRSLLFRRRDAAADAVPSGHGPPRWAGMNSRKVECGCALCRATMAP